MQLAQLNIAQAKYLLDAPQIKDFIDNLEHINGIAETSPGFIWRLKDDSGDATQIKAFDDPNMIINMSVWQSVEQLKDFMFKTQHRDFMRRKGEWFARLPEASYVLWWITDGHIPSIEEAIDRLMHLRKYGDSDHAFSFKSIFEPA